MFKLGTRSLSELQGVHPELVGVVQELIEVSSVDFGVIDGLRTLCEQQEYVNRGVSQTLKSKHLMQEDGFGHAVDLVPYVNGKYRWEEKPLGTLAHYLHKVATGRSVKIRWGGCWKEITSIVDFDSLREVQKYREKRYSQERVPFVDMPHFEIIV